ncbi:MAG: IPT/TIG domain-containing protein [Dichotomicrobium sp.]
MPDDQTSPPGDYSIKVADHHTTLQAHAFDPEKRTGPWRASTVYAVGDIAFETSPDADSLVLECTAVTGSAESGASEPSWDSTVGNTTTDNEVTWETLGTIAELTPLTQIHYQSVLVTSISPDYGDKGGGKTITITGAGFESGASVDIGDEAATNVTVVSDTEITCDAPALASGIYDVTVIQGGQTTTLPDAWLSIWTPAQVTSIQWWEAFDADSRTVESGEVTQIDDKSGNARDYTVPTSWDGPLLDEGVLNGRDAIKFDGTDRALEATGFPALGGDNRMFIVVGEITNYTDDDQGILWAHGDVTISGAVFVKTAEPGVRVLGGNRLYGNGVPVNLPRIFVFGNDGNDTTNIFHYLDGTLQSPTSTNSHTMDTAASAFLGIQGLGGSRRMSGKQYGGVAVSAITDDLRQNLEGYFAHVLGLTDNLESGHPYKDSPP